MNINENQHYTYSNKSSTFSIESHESSASEFQPTNRVAYKTQCIFQFKYEWHMMLPV